MTRCQSEQGGVCFRVYEVCSCSLTVDRRKGGSRYGDYTAVPRPARNSTTTETDLFLLLTLRMFWVSDKEPAEEGRQGPHEIATWRGRKFTVGGGR